MSVRDIQLFVTFVVSGGLHFVGDYAMQKHFSSFFKAKKSSFSVLLAHCAVAGGPAFAILSPSWQYALLGFVVGTAAHLAVDAFSIRGSLLLKLVDQGLHITALCLWAVLLWH